MPYGPVRKGTKETAADTAWMERCVSRRMKEGKSKQSAIRICKVIRARMKG